MTSSLDCILRPRSVAVIGASRKPNTIGWNILDNLLRHGFCGPVYPVNPGATSIHSIPACPSVASLPEAVDLAVVVVPKDHVTEVAEACAEKGIQGLVVVTAGFKEVGGEGLAREERLLDVVRSNGMRLAGPNCLGVLNTDPTVSMNATFAPVMPPAGNVAFISQSGAMGVSILDHACRLGIGISTFVSIGNRADLSGNDLLEAWADDPATDVILMYLESFGNPERFVEIARRVTRKKPVCIVKSGRTGAGQRAAASHTGSLAGTDLATDALIAQAGALRVPTVAALFDVAMAFANQPLPQGRRVAIVTNAGGPGIIAADAAETHGLDVHEFGEETQRTLREHLPEEASVRNPVDMVASADAASYERALECVLSDSGVDAAIAAFVPPLGVQAEEVAGSIARVADRHADKPVMAVLMAQGGLPAGREALARARVPAYLFPESAARSLAAMWAYQKTARRPEGRVPELPCDDAAVAALIDGALASGRQWLSEPDALRALELCGVPVVPWRMATAGELTELPEAAAVAATELGFPVVLKIVSPQVVHKTDVGGVVLQLRDADEVRAAASSLLDRMRSLPREGAFDGDVHIDGLLLQRMAEGGTETIVGMTRAPRIGPLVMFGLGGVFVEVLKDVVLRLAPLRDTDAAEMVRQVKLFALLEGVRGQPPSDLAALEQSILRVAQLACRHPRLLEMDLNPLLALPSGVLAVDARLRVGAPPGGS
jgi:acetyl coenzyme A synthetase (ADP forming)-like protein